MLTDRDNYTGLVIDDVENFPSRKPRMILTAKDFGKRVARGRKALGLSQRELARAINCGQRFIVDLEAGKPTAQLGKALAAAQAVGICLSDIATGSATAGFAMADTTGVLVRPNYERAADTE